METGGENLRELSCYSSSLLIQYALEHGHDPERLFKGIEDKRAALENPYEWADLQSFTILTTNFENNGGDLFKAGMEITEKQTSHFQLLLLKIAPFPFLIKNYSKHFREKITNCMELIIRPKRAGEIDLLFIPNGKIKYSTQVCDFNRGCAYAVGRIKKLKNYNFAEIHCAARTNSHECLYRLTWTPDPSLLDRLKNFFLFRFSSQKSILAHMEETYNRLQEQYSEAKKLNEQLMATLKEKERLSEELQQLNINLEKKVEEQTGDIRSKNVELERTNAQLRESERMKDLLTGALVHDIKNHIFSMASDVRALNSIEGCTEDAQEILSHTTSACSSAMSLASNMLDIGKMEEGRLVADRQPVDFTRIQHMLSRYTQNVFFKEKNISVTIESPEFDISFSADHYLLDRVLQNLLTNAAMYTPEAGEVRISFGHPATITVFNSGEPIPVKYRGTLFEKYARVNTDSSKYAKGLGLFFCRLVMQAHGGTIELECSEKGNIFRLRFE